MALTLSSRFSWSSGPSQLGSFIRLSEKHFMQPPSPCRHLSSVAARHVGSAGPHDMRQLYLSKGLMMCSWTASEQVMHFLTGTSGSSGYRGRSRCWRVFISSERHPEVAGCSSITFCKGDIGLASFSTASLATVLSAVWHSLGRTGMI